MNSTATAEATETKKTLHSLILDALVEMRAHEDNREQGQFGKALAVHSFVSKYMERGGRGNPFQVLAVQSKENHTWTGHHSYTQRHLRHFNAIACTWLELGGAEGRAPAVSPTHFLTVSNCGLTPEKKRELLLFAETHYLSVSQLKKRVSWLRGQSEAINFTGDLSKSVTRATKALKKVMKMIADHDLPLTQEEQDILAGLDSKISSYRGIPPEGGPVLQLAA